jgi:hypothetical protein
MRSRTCSTRSKMSPASSRNCRHRSVCRICGSDMWVGPWGSFRCSKGRSLKLRIRSVTVRRDGGHCKQQAVCAGTRRYYCLFYASGSHDQLPTPVHNLRKSPDVLCHFTFSHSDSSSLGFIRLRRLTNRTSGSETSQQ